MGTALKLHILTRVNVGMNDKGAGHLIDVFARIKSGEIPRDMAPPGYVAAIDKLPEGAGTEHILGTIVGEILGSIIQNEIPPNCPPAESGIVVRVLSTEYSEAPGVMAAPSDVVPLVVMPATRTLH